MAAIPDNVRQKLITLVPAALVNEISCFVFYDNHPLDEKNIDIIICTIHGEVREYFQRELVYCTVIDRCSKPEEIKILRSSKCCLFYFVSFRDEIVVLSRKDKIEVVQRIDNVDTYDLDDSVCNGRAVLKIIRKDDAVPLMFDDNFETLGDRSEIQKKTKEDDVLPIITELSRKLTEAKYSVKCNEKAFEDLLNLRKIVSCENFKLSGDRIKEEHGNALQCKSTQPLVHKYCDKIVIITEVINRSSSPAHDIHFLLHKTAEPSIVYTTKLFTWTHTPPYWKEVFTAAPNSPCQMVLILNLQELGYSLKGRLDIDGEISYKIQKEYSTKFPKCCVTAADIMSEDSDIVKTNSNPMRLLLMLAITKSTDLCVRCISEESNLNLLDLFQRNLQMERIDLGECLDALYKNSPYNVLHGVIVFEKQTTGKGSWIISVHTRMPSQILSFIHYVHDVVPHRLIITTTEQNITSKLPELSIYNEDTIGKPKRFNYNKFGASMANQAAFVLEYLDECMMKMNENKTADVQNKIGHEIDIFAGDIVSFKKKVLREIGTGVKSIHEDDSSGIDEGMVVDVD